MSGGNPKCLRKSSKLLGASPTQYRQLLKAEKLVDKRALEGKRGTMLSLALNCAIFFFMGLSTASMLLLPLDVFTYALISITMSMAMIGIWTIPYFDMLLSPIHYPIVAHTPVSSRTYFLVKLTQVLTHTVLLLASFNLPLAIAGIWIHVRESSQFLFLFPLAYLPIAFLSGFFTIGVMTVFAGYLTKLYTKKSLRNIAQYAQYIFPGLFPMVWILLPRLPGSLSDGGIEKLTPCSEMVLRAPKRLVCGCSLARTRRNRMAFSDFSRTRCCLNALFGVCPASEYRKELFRISLVLAGIRHSSEIRVKGENAAVRENDPKSYHPRRVLPRHRIFVSREAHIATTLLFVRWHHYNRCCIYTG